MEQQHSRLRGHNPGADSDDYFECRGNARALSYVRHAVLRGESFVVLTGPAGTGKTALLDTLMSGPGPVGVVAGRFAGARLDASGMLAAAAKALRAPAAGEGLAEIRAGLQAWLAVLTATDRRALLVVDDAQHLLPAALRELTDLASLRSSRDAPLQVVLAGRPELRLSLQHALRGGAAELVFLFCDVAPMSAIETRWYLEHRLQRIAGPGRPLFTDEAYGRIHQATAGVPRAINQLCDRLLALASQRRIGCIAGEAVDQAVRVWRAGSGDGAGWRPVAAAPAVTPPGILDEGRPPTRAAAARSTARRVVIALSVVAGAALMAWCIREYEGVLDLNRLSSLAAATRQAPAPAAAPAAPLAPAVGAVPITPSATLPAVRAEDAVLSRLPDAGPSAPPPAAPPCSEVVLALGLCNPEARKAELP